MGGRIDEDVTATPPPAEDTSVGGGASVQPGRPSGIRPDRPGGIRPGRARGALTGRRYAALREVPHWIAMGLGFYTVTVFLWSISPALRSVLRVPREFVDNYLIGAPDTSLSYALVLGLVAAALASRKQVAWWIAAVYMLAYTVLNLAQLAEDPDDAGAWLGLLAHLAVLALLLAARGEFYTKVRKGAARRALGVLFGGLAVGTVVGWILLLIFPGSLPRGEAILWSLNRVTALASVDTEQFSGRPHGFVNFLLGLFAFIALIAAVITLFRSQRADNALTGSDESAIRGLLAGSPVEDSLGYFATRRDKGVVFAPNGRAAITYRVELGVCIASGDPIGHPQAWPQAVDAWIDLARLYGWAPAVMGASETGARAYSQGGLSVLELGDEAILKTANYSLGGPEMRPVRQAVNRAKGRGVTVRIRRHRDVDVAEWPHIIDRADRWRDTDTERGFSMALGRLGDPLDGDCLLVEALVAEGDGTHLVGLLSLVPWGRAGVSLDLMRRDPQSPNGTIETMISELALTADRYGVNRISLNFAVFRAAFEEGGRIGAGPVARVWRSTLLFFSRWWQLEALYRSNLKFNPEWVPRYLCFEDNRDLPKVAIASATAEGFVTWPSFNRDASVHTGVEPHYPGALTAVGLHDDGSAPTDFAGAEQVGPRRPEQVRVRIAKLERLIDAGVDPYPVAYPPTHDIEAARESQPGTVVRVAGRLMRIRDHGGVVFADLRDFSADIQVIFDRAIVGDDLAHFTAEFDLGDLAEITGPIGASRSGELSLLATSWRMNGKSLHPLPDKWRGLTDPESRVRRRYLDIAVNPHSRDLIVKRSAVVKSFRDTFDARGFMEVETPILQQVHGGANAAPFLTHINAYNLDLYLRIAPELYLKRLCVAGMEKVFEIGRVFRNEGADFKHNPEFTILESYQAHTDYLDQMVLCRHLIQRAAVAAHGREIVLRPGPDGSMIEIDITGEWPVKTMHGAVSEKIGALITPATELDEVRGLARRAGVEFDSTWDAGHIAQQMYEDLVEGQTEFPTFYIDFPTSMSPLTRPHRHVAGVTEKWDLVAWGVELGTAYSELTDPVDQRARLTEQSALAAGGDLEAMELDEDFLVALEHAMPPTGGLGIGVDRVVMLITGASIRETLAFPIAKPRGQ